MRLPSGDQTGHRSKPVSNVKRVTITDAVNGRQYVAVMTGEGLPTGPVIQLSSATPARNRNGLHVFALPRAEVMADG